MSQTNFVINNQIPRTNENYANMPSSHANPALINYQNQVNTNTGTNSSGNIRQQVGNSLSSAGQAMMAGSARNHNGPGLATGPDGTVSAQGA